MVDRIKELCAMRGIKVSNLERELGFANGSIAKTSEKTEVGRILAIANYFAVSVEYILGEDESRVKDAPRLPDEDMVLLQGFHAASEDIQRTLLMIARDALGQKKRSSETFISSQDKEATA